MSDIKKWMDIVVGAERLASQLADIQSAATSAIESEESESVSKNNGVTVNLSLDLGDLKNALLGGQSNNSVLPSVQGTIPTVTKQPITRTSTVIQKAPANGRFQENDTVTVLPSVGGGVGRFVGYSKNGACIDIKGVERELSLDQFCSSDRDSEDPYDSGNDWFHKSIEPYTAGLMKDKPEFRPGDIVKIADVYGAVIGPGFGIFVAYSTTGKECIISFDDKEIIVPTSNVEAVLEQNAKDNFDQMDNDGNLSPISFGSQNIKVEESTMDQRDDFSKWMSAVEEALHSDSKPELEETRRSNKCGCGSWKCPVCFPDENGKASESPPPLEVDGLAIMDDEEMVDETDNDFVQKPRGGKGVKLGDIVTKTEVRPTDGHNSPETYGEDNLLAQPRAPRTQDDVEPAGFSSGQDSPLTDVGEDDGLTILDDDEGNWYDPDEEDTELEPDVASADAQTVSQIDDDPGIDDTQEMVDKIMNIQAMGFSKDDRHYSRQDLMLYSPEELQACHDRVMGTVSEAKPIKTKTDDPFDPFADAGDDILNPKKPDLPTTLEPDDDEIVGDDEPMNLPTSSRADTQRKVGAITGTDQMRDFMNRIDPNAGGAEPGIPEVPQDAVVVRTAADVPAVISQAIQASGMQNPAWHTIDNLPGYMQRNIRGMGRQVFGMFTSTPLENIQTLSNVNGQGPNTDAEMRSVAGWLRDNAEDLGTVNVSHGMAIPGYEPDVKEYRANGVRFQIVRDPMGQYIYAYPEKDAKLHQGGGQGRLPGDGGMPGQGGGGMPPRLREMEPTLFERLKWDEEILEAFVTESTLSRLIGKQQGGQALVRWLHKKHKLSNEASLEPAEFSKEMLWSQFKNHPDNFVIVSGEGGVAGIRPSQKHIEAMTKRKAAKGETYNPGRDGTMPYQIIAYTNNGEQVNPELLHPPAAPGEEPEADVDADPTIHRARMGKKIGTDLLNKNNTFKLLNDQIGPINTVWISGWGGYRGEPESIRPSTGSVERVKMSGRDELKKAGQPTPDEAVQKIFTRIRPVLKTITNQAILQIHQAAQLYLKGGNFEAAQKIMGTGQKLKQLLVSLDTNQAVNVDTSAVSRTKELSTAISQAISKASGGQPGTPQYNEYAVSAANGSLGELRPILDALRDKLVGL